MMVGWVLTDYDGGRFFFSITKEGETFMFASEDDNERHLWVQAMYRATGQAHKPQPPASITTTNNAKAPVNSPLSRIQGGRLVNPYTFLPPL